MARSWEPDPANRAYLEHRVRQAQQATTPPDVMLLRILFGADLRPTARGLWAARLVLVLAAFLVVIATAWILGGTADVIVDPTPELPAVQT